METLLAPPRPPVPRVPYTPEDLQREPNYPLWARLRDGDRSVRDTLVERYAPLVKFVIGRMAISLPPVVDGDDVLSAGTMGLLQAVDRYHPDMGVKFETYALQRIRGAIIDLLRSVSHLSRGAGRRARLLDEAASRLAHVHGRSPTRAEIADELGVSMDELNRMLVESAHAIVSLDSAIPGDDAGVQSLADLLRDDAEATPDAILEEAETTEHLAAAIATLAERDQLVLNLYYTEELTLKEISAVLGVSESRVSQLHTSAILKLRAILRTTVSERAA